MSHDESGSRSLPVYRHQEEIIAAVSTHQVVVIEGPTGSGKTTQIPQILLSAALWKGLIGVTQPRRIAAVSVARRIATEMGVGVGQAVGYAIRFEDVTGPRTLLKIMTDGILLQEARSDPDFSSYSLLMIDEAHERSLNIDLCLGLLYRVLQRRRDLRVVVSSATLKPEEFQEFFQEVVGEVPRISIQGRPFPIQVQYSPPASRKRPDLTDALADQVTTLHRQGAPGHILVFLTGEEMIEKTARNLAHTCPDRDLVVLPMFGRMKREEQDRVFEDFPGRRKVVLATNIAETSITIPDVRYVVDTGLVKLPRFNTRTGISALQEEPISRASAEQRAGRAGRTGPGKVIRLYDRAELLRQPRFTDEEIRRLDLSEVVLRLVDLGIREVEDFPFPTRPSRHMIRAAVFSLQTMGAIDRERQLTPIGRRMVPFPLSPFLARMVVEAADRFPDVVDEVLVVGAFLSVRTPMLFPLGEEDRAREALAAFAHPLGDALTAVQMFRLWSRARDRVAYSAEHYLDPDIMAFIEKAHDQLADIAREGGIEVKGGGEPEGIVRCLAAACADKVLKREGRGSTYVTPLEVKVGVHPSSVLFGTRHPFLVAAEIVLSTRTFARQVSVCAPEWIKEVNPQAASRWHIKGRAGPGRKRSLGQVAQPPTHIELGEVTLPVSRHRDRCQVDLMLRQVEALKAFDPRDVPHEHARWPAVIQAPQGRFAGGTTLSRLICLLPYLVLPEPGDSLRADAPEGELLDIGEDWHTIAAFLDRLLEPMLPARGRQPGWLALLANGMDEYWFEVMRDFYSALSTTVLSLEDLVRVLTSSDRPAERAQAALERMGDLLEQVDEALERWKGRG